MINELMDQHTTFYLSSRQIRYTRYIAAASDKAHARYQPYSTAMTTSIEHCRPPQ